MAQGPRRKDGGAAANNPLFDKSLGQHILKNPLVAQAIVDKADIQPGDTVLEIGPGTGNLTVKLLEKAKTVIAVEKDPRMAAELLKRVQSTMPDARRRLQLIVGDVLRAKLPPFDVCVSNTPYQISSPLTFMLLAQRPAPRAAVLMFQREFALRLAAGPGTPLYCRLSANAQLLARVTHVLKVSRNSFRPPPQVDSSVVRVEPYSPAPPVVFSEWDGLLRVLFLRKNKTVAANLKTTAVLAMLLRNYRANCAREGRSCDLGASMDVGNDASTVSMADGSESEAEDSELEAAPVSGELAEVRSRVTSIVEAAGMADVRAAKMDTDDFLRLLVAFKEAGFPFC